MDGLGPQEPPLWKIARQQELWPREQDADLAQVGDCVAPRGPDHDLGGRAVSLAVASDRCFGGVRKPIMLEHWNFFH